MNNQANYGEMCRQLRKKYNITLYDMIEETELPLSVLATNEMNCKPANKKNAEKINAFFKKIVTQNEYIILTNIFEGRKIHEISHADIVVTHKCNLSCPHCIDKFKGENKDIINPKHVYKFLNLLKTNTIKTKEFKFDQNPKTEILLLGGEPTMAGFDLLTNIALSCHDRDFEVCMSTNGILKGMINQLIPYFDWVQITVRNKYEIDYWRKNKHKVNVKLAGDRNLTYKKFLNFVHQSSDYQRKSLTMYFDNNLNELCQDKEMHEYLDSLEWERAGSYLYTFDKGVRIKRCIKDVTNIADEPMIPKLYPNGHYNKTWKNEKHDPYLGEYAEN